MNSYSAELQKLYVAYFKRPGDPVGLDYWQRVLESGAATLDGVAKVFGESQEYLAEYANLSIVQRVDRIYENLFGRAADAPGRQYWSTLLETGVMSIDVAVRQIAQGAQGSDLLAFNSKLAAADSFVIAVMQKEGGTAAYNGRVANDVAADYLAGIIDTATLAAATTPAYLESILSRLGQHEPPLFVSRLAQARSELACADAITKLLEAGSAVSAETAAIAAAKAAAEKLLLISSAENPIAYSSALAVLAAAAAIAGSATDRADNATTAAIAAAGQAYMAAKDFTKTARQTTPASDDVVAAVLTADAAAAVSKAAAIAASRTHAGAFQPVGDLAWGGAPALHDLAYAAHGRADPDMLVKLTGVIDLGDASFNAGPW